MSSASRKPGHAALLLVIWGIAAQAGEPGPASTGPQIAPGVPPPGESPAQQVRAVAASRLATVEEKFGPDSTEVIGPLIALVAATVVGGDATKADQLLVRADRLLDLHPSEDRSLRLAVLVLQSENFVRQNRLLESNEVLYKALSLSRSTTTIDALEQADVLDRLAANESRRGEVVRAGDFTKNALKLREKHYGKSSFEYSSALLKAADWYRLSGRFDSERDLENEALAILENQFGPRDSRLAVPLIRIATSYTAQRVHWQQAEQALQRAAGLDFKSTRDDVFTKAEILASLADLRVVFGKPEDSTAFYVNAWQAIGTQPQFGAPAANAYFGKVRQLFVAPPEEIANTGGISLVFTVTPIGTVDEVRIVENNVPNPAAAARQDVKEQVGAATWRAIQRSRYRPRVIDGAAVATTGLNFSNEFCIDAQENGLPCKGSADVIATH